MNLLLTLPNILSLLRLPLAGLLFLNDPLTRVLAIVLAMGSDMLDGYYARTYNITSRLGTLLDPATDKIFVFTALALFLYEGQLTSWELMAFLSRDLSILIFTAYLLSSGQFTNYRSHAIICGKITTGFQFLLLIGVALNMAIPPYLYMLMALFGSLSLIELLNTRMRNMAESKNNSRKGMVQK